MTNRVAIHPHAPLFWLFSHSACHESKSPSLRANSTSSSLYFECVSSQRTRLRNVLHTHVHAVLSTLSRMTLDAKDEILKAEVEMVFPRAPAESESDETTA